MANVTPSENWEMDTVIDELRARAKRGEAVAAQVFLHGTQAGDDLGEFAQKLVGAASAVHGGKAHKASIGRVSNLAKSFSLRADPEVFVRLAKEPSVKAILPSQIDDVYPKPVKMVRE